MQISGSNDRIAVKARAVPHHIIATAEPAGIRPIEHRKRRLCSSGGRAKQALARL
jgi:hypothetical protein